MTSDLDPPDLPTMSRDMPKGWRIYAVGDVHGRFDLLATLIRKIEEDIEAAPCPSPLCVFLGDYVDRGPDSARVLDALIWLQARRAVICLMGNHESYFRRTLVDPAFLPHWLQYGGVETMRSYGIEVPQRLTDRMTTRLAAELAKASSRHHAFIGALPATFSIGDYFFCHAGVRPGVPLGMQLPEDLMMIREPFLSHPDDFGKLVVHGHTPTKEPEIRANRIGIDTMAFATSRLTCLVIEGDKIRFL